MKEGKDGNAGPSSGAEDGVATETEGGEEWREREAGWRRLRARVGGAGDQLDKQGGKP